MSDQAGGGSASLPVRGRRGGGDCVGRGRSPSSAVCPSELLRRAGRARLGGGRVSRRRRGVAAVMYTPLECKSTARCRLSICRTTSCTADPQQLEVMEFERQRRRVLESRLRCGRRQHVPGSLSFLSASPRVALLRVGVSRGHCLPCQCLSWSLSSVSRLPGSLASMSASSGVTFLRASVPGIAGLLIGILRRCGVAAVGRTQATRLPQRADVGPSLRARPRRPPVLHGPAKL